MKSIFILLISLCISLGYTISYAAPPIISQNVPVVQNATPDQCPYDWKGDAGPVDVATYTRFGGEDDSTGPGVRSCTGCSIDSRTQACVCRTCYDYFDIY